MFFVILFSNFLRAGAVSVSPPQNAILQNLSCHSLLRNADYTSFWDSSMSLSRDAFFGDLNEAGVSPDQLIEAVSKVKEGTKGYKKVRKKQSCNCTRSDCPVRAMFIFADLADSGRARKLHSNYAAFLGKFDRSNACERSHGRPPDDEPECPNASGFQIFRADAEVPNRNRLCIFPGARIKRSARIFHDEAREHRSYSWECFRRDHDEFADDIVQTFRSNGFDFDQAKSGIVYGRVESDCLRHIVRVFPSGFIRTANETTDEGLYIVFDEDHYDDSSSDGSVAGDEQSAACHPGTPQPIGDDEFQDAIEHDAGSISSISAASECEVDDSQFDIFNTSKCFFPKCRSIYNNRVPEQSQHSIEELDQIVDDAAQAIVQRHDMFGKACSDDPETRERCAAAGHRNRECDDCKIYDMTSRQHRSRPQGVNVGSASFDLLQVGGDHYLIAVTRDAEDKNVYLAYELRSKLKGDVVPYVRQALIDFTFLYDVHPVKRCHSDRESAVYHSREQLSQAWIKFSFNTGHDPASNGIAERSLRTLCSQARRSLSHIKDSYTRQVLWGAALRHAAYFLTESTGGRLGALERVPFMSRVAATIPHDKAADEKLEPIAARAAFLYPSYDVSRAAEVLVINDDGRAGRQAPSANVSAIKSDAGLYQCVDAVIEPSARRADRITVTIECDECHEIRRVSKKTAKKIHARGRVHCGRLIGAKCRVKNDTTIFAGRRGALGARMQSNKTVFDEIAARAAAKHDLIDVVRRAQYDDDTGGEAAIEEFALKNQIFERLQDSFSKKEEELFGAEEAKEAYCSKYEDLANKFRSTQDSNGINAFVTRLCTPAELKAPQAIAAGQKEMTELLDHLTLAEPEELDAVCQLEEEDHLGRTLSGSMLITSIKNVELLIEAERAATRKTVKANVARCQEEFNLVYDGTMSFRAAAAPKAESRLREICVQTLQLDEEQKQLNELLQRVPSTGPDVDFPEREAKKGSASDARPKWKGRFVVLGHLISKLTERDRIVFGKKAAPFDEFGRTTPRPDMWHPISSLAAARQVQLHALTHGWRCTSTDLSNAYVQVPWSATAAAPHYLTIAKDIRALFPPGPFQGLGMTQPVYRLKRCLYGHPLSGTTFVKRLCADLQSVGFCHCESCPGLMRRPFCNDDSKFCLVSAYVDDLCAGADDAEQKRFYNDLERLGYKMSEPYTCSKFLGLSIAVRGVDGNGDTSVERAARLSMPAYIDVITSTYQSNFGGNITAAPSPATEDVRGGHVHVNEFTQVFTSQQIKDVQCTLGQCLWLGRQCRPDVCCAVSFLSSRISCWDPACQAQLKRLVSYLQHTREFGLTWVIGAGVGPEDLGPVLYFDSDHHVPKSQTGWVLMLQTADGSSQCTYDWGSTRQSLPGTSTGQSELLACFSSVSAALGAAIDQTTFSLGHEVLPDSFGRFAGYSVALRGDNLIPLKICSRGWGKVAASLKARHRTYGLKCESLRDMTSKLVIAPGHCRSSKNSSDLLTKTMSVPEHVRCTAQLGVSASLSFTREVYNQRLQDVNSLDSIQISSAGDQKTPLLIRLGEDEAAARRREEEHEDAGTQGIDEQIRIVHYQDVGPGEGADRVSHRDTPARTTCHSRVGSGASTSTSRPGSKKEEERRNFGIPNANKFSAHRSRKEEERTCEVISKFCALHFPAGRKQEEHVAATHRVSDHAFRTLFENQDDSSDTSVSDAGESSSVVSHHSQRFGGEAVAAVTGIRSISDDMFSALIDAKACCSSSSNDGSAV